MKPFEVLNFGSLNIDHVYRVPHFVRPGETLTCSGYAVFAGGKGLNQSIALARAGVTTAHAGKIGPDGEFLLRTLQENGIDTSFVLRENLASGNAIIQVDRNGQNAILLDPGANHAVSETDIRHILQQIPPKTVLMLQNEISHIPALITEAKKRGLTVAFNPAPCGPEVTEYPLDQVDILFVNEIEGAQLAGTDGDETLICDRLAARYPNSEIVMTLGGAGAVYVRGTERLRVSSPEVKVVDTTSAGDTFIGYFIASRLRGYGVRKCMECAALAGSIAVSRAGAAASIPVAEEIFRTS
jgi:ribokinase